MGVICPLLVGCLVVRWTRLEVFGCVFFVCLLGCLVGAGLGLFLIMMVFSCLVGVYFALLWLLVVDCLFWYLLCAESCAVLCSFVGVLLAGTDEKGWIIPCGGLPFCIPVGAVLRLGL